MDLKIVCEDEKYMPKMANETDACFDLKVKINIKTETETFTKKMIAPGETVVFGTGIKVAVPLDHVMEIFPRSSTGIKLNLMLSNTTGIIDAGYRDEIKMALTNFGDKYIEIEDGQRIAQFMVIPRPRINLVLVKDDEDFRTGDRGGGIGSSGKF